MASPDDTITRWFDVQRGNKSRYLSCGNIVSSRDVLYSYGQHFPLVRMIRDKNGDRDFWLLNGDTFSVTTARHQSMVRGELRGDRHVIIPDSVLTAAGIDHANIRLLDVTPDRTVTTEHESREIPPRAKWHTQEHYKHVPWSEQEKADYAKDKYDEQLSEYQKWTTQGHDYWEDEITKMRAQTPTQWMEHKRDWRYEQALHDHLSHTTQHLRVSWQEVEVTHDEHGPLYRWETTRHWLGESLIEARIPHYWRTKVCTDCNGTGFLRVHAGEDNFDREQGWKVMTRGGCAPCRAEGRLRTKQVFRTAKFLSGFDRNETRPSYFFCELPKCDASTVEEAIEALKPESVRLAEQLGREVVRQGDIFGIAAPSLDRRALTKAGAKYTKRGRLFGTNHEATETAELPDGRLYARGCLRHVPEGWRAPDHARCTLPAGWSLIQKNTVPLTA